MIAINQSVLDKHMISQKMYFAVVGHSILWPWWGQQYNWYHKETTNWFEKAKVHYFLFNIDYLSVLVTLWPRHVSHYGLNMPNSKYMGIIRKFSKCLKIHIFVGIYHSNQSIFNDGNGIMPKKYLHSESKIKILDKKYLNRFQQP